LISNSFETRRREDVTDGGPRAGQLERARGFEQHPPSAVRIADLVAVARRSPFATELLASPDLRDRASSAVSRAVNWIEDVGVVLPDWLR
jgi:hypothetical protein